MGLDLKVFNRDVNAWVPSSQSLDRVYHERTERIIAYPLMRMEVALSVASELRVPVSGRRAVKEEGDVARRLRRWRRAVLSTAGGQGVVRSIWEHDGVRNELPACELLNHFEARIGRAEDDAALAEDVHRRLGQCI